MNFSYHRNKSGFVLLSSIFLVLFLSILLGAAFLRSQSRLQEADLMLPSHRAFYSAESGLERALYELRRNPEWGLDTGLDDDGEPIAVLEDEKVEVIPSEEGSVLGFFTVRVLPAAEFRGWPTVWVRSIGSDFERRVRRSVLARVIVANPTRFMALTFGNFQIGSGAEIKDDVFGRDVSFVVNTSLPAGEQTIDVKGKVYYLENLAGIPDPAVIFEDSNEQLIKSDPITFIGVQLDRYRLLAQDQGEYFSSDLVLDLGSYSEDNAPSIIFVEGDLTVSGNFPKSMIVVASGDVLIDGDILPADDLAGETVPQLGLLAAKDVIITENAPTDNNLSIEAFLLADGQGDDSDGIIEVRGGPYYPGELNFKGSMSARGENVDSVFRLSAFQTRNYEFNPDLSQNTDIPFLPFFVNSVNWQEVNPNDLFLSLVNDDDGDGLFELAEVEATN